MIIEQPIRTPRLELRSLAPGDANETYLAWLHDPEVNQYLEIRHDPPGLESLSSFIKQMNESKQELLLGICVKDGSHVGNIKLGPIDSGDHRAAIGILIGDRAWWGKGVATEAIEALTQYAFEELSLHRVEAGCYESNIGSARAFEKAGWSIEGRRKHRRATLHGWEDEILMGCVRPG
ncbi:MAG: GNAT family N-acetyltransferase [Phycisphaerales bacterium]|nr:GNAT family N-acetyltransferase [Phycisphaerales bacterium]